MNKEIVICIIIVVFIVIGDVVTQKYTKNSIHDISDSLQNLREEMVVKDVKWDVAKEKLDNINDKWSNMYEKMTYYLEHDELEKVETNLTGIKSFIDMEEDSDTVEEIDKSIFVLKHIEEKNKFEIKNIF